MNNERAQTIFTVLRETYPEVRGTALNFNNALELLVATILSAQCTDEKVNEVTQILFQKYNSVKDYAEANVEELQQIIKSTGFYRKKAQFIKKATQKLMEGFHSEIPRSIKGLSTLPGVARKTANIVLSNAFGLNEGIAVDTHVLRLSQRLGFSILKNRDKVEKDLMTLFPKNQWFALTNLLIAHGRTVCGARNPQCGECVVNRFCPSAVSR
jgi:endonuclease-3